MIEYFTLSGRIISGRGIAASIVSDNSERIEPLLGATPYAGTLNIVMESPFFIKKATQIDIKGKQFAILGHIGEIPCLIYRWHNAPLHVIEVISSVRLRDVLDLKDGYIINIQVRADKIRPVNAWRLSLWRLFYQHRPRVYYNDDLHKFFTGKYLKHFHKRACQRKSEFV